MTNLRICSTAFLTSPLKEEGGQVSEVRIAYLAVMDLLTLKTSKFKYRHHWCLIRLKTGDTVGHVGIFDTAL
jgi:hypothetical protein